jgi:hypothetical protein
MWCLGWQSYRRQKCSADGFAIFILHFNDKYKSVTLPFYSLGSLGYAVCNTSRLLIRVGSIPKIPKSSDFFEGGDCSMLKINW